MGRNLARRARAMAEIEATYGTEPTWAAGADGFYLYNNATPVGFDGSSQEIDAIRDSFDPVPDAPGRFLRPFSPQMYLGGSGAAGTAIRFNDLIRACGVDEAVAASSVTYTPQDPASLESCAVYFDADGIAYKILGCYGNFRVAGRAGQPVTIDFDMRGKWTAPHNTPTASFASFDPGSNYAQAFKGANLSIDNGTVTWTKATSNNNLVFKSFSFDRGVEIGEITDANSDDGFDSLLIQRAVPRGQLVIAMKQTLTSLIEFETDMKNQTLHDISFQVGVNGAGQEGREALFNWPEAQVVNVAYADGEGGTREITIDYKLTSATANSAFSIVTS